MFCLHLRLAAQTAIESCVEVFSWNRCTIPLLHRVAGCKVDRRKNAGGSGLQDLWASHRAQPPQVFQPSSPSSLATTSANWIIVSDESFRLEPQRTLGSLFSPSSVRKESIWPFYCQISPARLFWQRPAIVSVTLCQLACLFWWKFKLACFVAA